MFKCPDIDYWGSDLATLLTNLRSGPVYSEKEGALLSNISFQIQTERNFLCLRTRKYSNALFAMHSNEPRDGLNTLFGSVLGTNLASQKYE
jgi:hypothetical protein